MICYALLAHEDEKGLLQQVRNIKKYNRDDVFIVLYNGGHNRKFGKKVAKKEKIQICPYSRPFEPKGTGRMFYDVARWLEETKVKYDYLVYFESDMMFVNHGFEDTLDELLKDHDCVWKIARTISDPHKTKWEPGKMMLEVIEPWVDIFPGGTLTRTFNPLQTYRRSMISKMLKKIHPDRLEEFFSKVKIRCMGEMLYPSLAAACGAKIRTFPGATKKFLRWRPPLTVKDIKRAKEKNNIFAVHPVKDKEVREWIYKNL
ncbi:hypothetical protein [Ammoniphilus sp. YIM 78166]|uniref:hypothetical protein n=1 Tax=Ammoniphilus sp. YIM 78166 TaxID=1644106 RepID=UPI00106FF808|nr:hypothetical protein [Ammoniphilus sp. YIM 78166]